MNRIQSDQYWYNEGRKVGASETISKMLEIIDTVNDDLDFGTKEKCVALSIKEKFLALKGDMDEDNTSAR